MIDSDTGISLATQCLPPSIDPIRDPEIVIGLVGPLGVDLEMVTEVLQDRLRAVGYHSHIIRLSQLLHGIRNLHAQIDPTYEDTRIRTLMKAGTEFRERLKRGDALSLLAVGAIRQYRQKQNPDGSPTTPVPRHAFILRSFKNRAEIETLRDIYGPGLIVISAYSPKKQRREDIAARIARSHHSFDKAKYYPEAEELINIDEDEEGKGKYGQDVGGAFPIADLFIEVTSRDKVEGHIIRFIEILFQFPFHTPTRAEFGMFQAKAAAFRSADLSRQVGAAIVNQHGEVVTVGCNEVPRAGGGVYWSDSPQHDHRDFKEGADSSAIFKTQILSEALFRLREAGMLASPYAEGDPALLASSLIYGENSDVMRDAQINNILEYGRIVHAEMAAISDAARRGLPLQGATLYCTTFPCHMCARHIIASGISRVIYVEPYPKSRAPELYKESIEVDALTSCGDKVSFQPFVGIAPRRYMDFFEMVKRKDGSGRAVRWDQTKAVPRLRRFVASYIAVETYFLGRLETMVRDAGLELS